MKKHNILISIKKIKGKKITLFALICSTPESIQERVRERENKRYFLYLYSFTNSYFTTKISEINKSQFVFLKLL